MANYKFEQLLTNEGWVSPCYIKCDSHGRIIYCSKEDPEDKSDFISIDAIGIPGFINAHSHAFQYAMAGLAEGLSSGHSDDDFWGWRESMYKLALNIDPDQMEAIATLLYKEMLRNGYTSVAEFHYLHHDKSGNTYQNLSEMGERLISAAKTAGINITLIPVYYNTGDFGKPAFSNQKRFISTDPENYFKLIESTKKSCKHYSGANTGLGLHSLRASSFDNAIAILNQDHKETPIHIHIAEQIKEIQSCVEFCGQRPVEWLLNHIDVGENFNLVHATHLNRNEITGIAKSKATVVICPTTEGNLGDGIFPLIEFLKEGGNISIGSDSHVSVSPIEELKFLDYVQRVVHKKRNVVCNKGGDESGDLLFQKVNQGGYQSLLNNHGFEIKKENILNITLIDKNHPRISNRENSKILSSIIYGADQKIISGTIVRGKLTSFENGKQILDNYIKTLSTLK